MPEAPADLPEVSADFSTGCARCDDNPRRKAIEYGLKLLLDEGRIFDTGERRPCGRCGRPLPVMSLDTYRN